MANNIDWQELLKEKDMQEEKLVSVIVPIYKVEDYLDNCVKSILCQSYRDIEVILVDDGSPDKCPSMCDEYAVEDERIKVIHKQNGGLSDARNVGIAVARGKYIFCVDSDDTIEKNTIEMLVDLAAEHRAQIVATTKKCENNRFDTVIGTGEEIYKQILERTTWEAWGKLFEYELIKDMQYPIGKLYEDLGYVPYAFLRAEKAVLIDNGMYQYTIRESSIMGQEENTFVSSDLVDIVEQLIEYTRIHHKEVYNCTFVRYMGLLYYKYKRTVKSSETKNRNQEFINSMKKFLHKVRRELWFMKGMGPRMRMKLIVLAYFW